MKLFGIKDKQLNTKKSETLDPYLCRFKGNLKEIS